MKLEYDIIETVQEKDLEFLDKEGKTIFVDAIRTDYVPTNFEGSPKNYVLRETIKWTWIRIYYNIDSDVDRLYCRYSYTIR